MISVSYTHLDVYKRQVVLYGFGSGTTAIFRMMNQLQQEIEREMEEDSSQTDTVSPSSLTAMDIKKRISAVIVDSPARDSDEFIKAAIAQEDHRWFFWLKDTTPYTVRMSLGNSSKMDHFTDFTTLTLPVMIFGHEKDRVLPEEAYRPMIEERMRLHPAWTSIYRAVGSGHLSSYDDNPDAYTEALLDFLQKWFPNTK